MNFFIKMCLNNVSCSVDIGKYSIIEALIHNNINVYEFYGPSLFFSKSYPLLKIVKKTNLVNTLDEELLYKQTRNTFKSILLPYSV